MTTEAASHNLKYHTGNLLSHLSKERNLPKGQERRRARSATVFAARNLLTASIGAEVDIFTVIGVLHKAVPSMALDINRAVGEGLTHAAKEAK